MKKLVIIIVLWLGFSACNSIKSTSINKDKSSVAELSNQVVITINKSKGVFRQRNWVQLYINVSNNSDQLITLLSPKSQYGKQVDYFYARVECSEPTISEAPYPPVILRNDNELVSIPPKKSRGFLIKGNLYDVICDSGSISVQISYDSAKGVEQLDYIKDEELKANAIAMLKKITRLSIQSESTEIRLN